MMRKVISLVVVVTILHGCATVPVTGRKQLSLVSSDEINAMAAQQYTEVIKKGPLSTNVEQTEMVRRVGVRIQKAVEQYMASKGSSSQLAGFKWEFNLIQDDKTVNAWCMPGGKVVVYSALLPVTKDETGLAFVMGHEIAHAVARHGKERMSQMLLAQSGGIALDLALANKPAQTRSIFNTAYGVGTTVGVLLPYSRLQESEADKLGMIFMAMAGYDPRQAPAVWQRMMKINTGEKPPEILSTHPAEDTRIDQLKEFMPEALKYYKPVNSK